MILDPFLWVRCASGNVYCQIGRFQEVQKNWFQADRTCQEHDSYLVQIDSSEENAAIFGEIQRIGVGSRVHDAWLGLTRPQLDDGNWTLMSSVSRGQAPSFVNWGGPLPDSPICATMKTSDGHWRAIDCLIDYRDLLIICEKSTPVKTARNEGSAMINSAKVANIDINSFSIRTHLLDNSIAVAGLNVGDLVRVRASVSRPEYGWGDVDHASIGQVRRLGPVIVDFPEQEGWQAVASELEVVVDDSEGNTVFKHLKN